MYIVLQGNIKKKNLLKKNNKFNLFYFKYINESYYYLNFNV